MSRVGRVRVEDAELRILGSLAEAPKSFYDLVQREKIASPNTVLEALKRLETYMQIERGEPEARKRVPYSFTVFGLARAFGDPKVRFHGPKAVESYSDVFPLIFGKWEFYKSEDLAFDIIGMFTAACRKNMDSIEFMMEGFDRDLRKHAEREINEYPEQVTFYKTIYEGEELLKTLESLKTGVEDAKKILALSEEEYEKYKAEHIKEVQEDFQAFDYKFVERITKETLFTFSWVNEFLIKLRNVDWRVTFKRYYEGKAPILRKLIIDAEIRELIHSCIEEEIMKNRAHVEALEGLKEIIGS